MDIIPNSYGLLASTSLYIFFTLVVDYQKTFFSDRTLKETLILIFDNV